MLSPIVAFLTATQNRETFFRLIATIYPTLDPRYKLIEKAYDDAKGAFRGKHRESGERYFEHLRGVTLILILYLGIRDHRLIIAALLHDIVEDCPDWPTERVVKEYGEEIALLVQWLTKPSLEFCGGNKEKVDEIYHERFEFASREFFILKLSDRLHNLITLWGCSKEKRTRKIIETHVHYLPWARKHLILHREIDAALEILERNEKIM